jgi:hypothetical protein
MKYNNSRIYQWLFFSAYLILVTLYIYKFINPELHFHAQQPPFQETMYFFNSYLTYPGGLIEYFSVFLAQFFYFASIGSVIFIVFSLLLVSLLNHILGEIENFKLTRFFLCLLASSIFIALLNNCYFPLSAASKVILAYAFINLHIYTDSKNINSIFSFLILSVLLFYIAGGGALIMFSVSLAVLLIYKKGVKATGILLTLIMLLALALPYLAYKYIFSISLIRSYFNIIQDLPVNAMYENNLLLTIFVVYLPCILLLMAILSFFYNRFKAKKQANTNKENNLNTQVAGRMSWYSKSGFRYFILFVLTFTVTVIILFSTQNNHKKNIVLADYYTYHQKYDEAIKVALSDTTYDITMNICYNNTINSAGRFLELFFDYPQYMGEDALYPDRLGSVEHALLISDYYFELGYISKSQHWANAALVLMPYNIRALQRLALINLINGNYMACGTILNVLSNNFISRGFALHYFPYLSDTTLIYKDSLILEKRAFMPHNFAISENISDRFYDLIVTNDKNLKAYEHLQMSFLLNHKLGYFMKNLIPSVKSYRKLPKVYEHAILMYMSQVKKLLNIRLSKISQTEFDDFIRIFHDSNNDKDIARPYLEKYKNTYMYYVIYNSPLVTGLTLQRSYIQIYK